MRTLKSINAPGWGRTFVSENNTQRINECYKLGIQVSCDIKIDVTEQLTLKEPFRGAGTGYSVQKTIEVKKGEIVIPETIISMGGDIKYFEDRGEYVILD